jgi:hypothetical protein
MNYFVRKIEIKQTWIQVWSARDAQKKAYLTQDGRIELETNISQIETVIEDFRPATEVEIALTQKAISERTDEL